MMPAPSLAGEEKSISNATTVYVVRVPTWNQVMFVLPWVIRVVVDHQTVAIVECHGMDADEDLLRTWSWHRSIQVVESQGAWTGNLPCLVRHDVSLQRVTRNEKTGDNGAV